MESTTAAAADTAVPSVSFEHFVSIAVGAAAESLGERWQRQARSVAPRSAMHRTLADPVHAVRVVTSLGLCLRDEGCWQDEMMREGWEFGESAHETGLTLHYMLKEIDLLVAMALYAAERAAGEYPGTASAVAGIALARRLHRSFSLFTLASAKGFTHGYLRALRGQLSTVRHDLRNPLGTIRNALSMMDDERVSPERRNDPRYRAMLSRNASALDALISRELGDPVVLPAEFVRQEVSLRDVALAVRRDLREEARAAGSSIEVQESLPTVMIDSTGFELILKSVAIAALRRARAGTVVRIALEALEERAAIVRVTFPRAGESGRSDGAASPETALAFARQLAERTGGRLWTESDAFIQTRLLERR